MNPMFRIVDPKNLFANESLKTIIEHNHILIMLWKKDMEAGKREIITAHGNTLRALVKYFDNKSNVTIIRVNIPTKIPLEYKFDENFKVIKHYYLGNQEDLKLKWKLLLSKERKK